MRKIEKKSAEEIKKDILAKQKEQVNSEYEMNHIQNRMDAENEEQIAKQRRENDRINEELEGLEQQHKKRLHEQENLEADLRDQQTIENIRNRNAQIGRPSEEERMARGNRRQQGEDSQSNGNQSNHSNSNSTSQEQQEEQQQGDRQDSSAQQGDTTGNRAGTSEMANRPGQNRSGQNRRTRPRSGKLNKYQKGPLKPNTVGGPKPPTGGGGGAEAGGQAAGASRGASRLSNAVSKAKSARNAVKAAKAVKAAGILAGTPIGWIILGVIIAIVALFLIMGAIAFFMYMPGMVSEKLWDIGNKIWTNIESGFIPRSEAEVKKEDVYTAAQYLENMGYSLKGYGFGEVTERQEDENGQTKITKMKDSPIADYLVAENKIYLVRRQNVNISDIAQNFFSGFGDMLEGRMIDWNQWGDGMLAFYRVPRWGASIGTILWDAIENTYKDIIENRTGINFKPVEVKRDNKTMTIYSNKNFKTIAYTYNMDGWTGRYGKPYELFLSLHLGTMAPDMTTKLANDDAFDTTVRIGLYPITISSKAYIMLGGNKVYEEGIDEIISEYNRLDGLKNKAKEDLEKAKRDLENTEAAYARSQETGVEDTSSPLDPIQDAAQNIYDQTGSTSQVPFVPRKTTAEDVENARAKVREAEEALAEAQANLDNHVANKMGGLSIDRLREIREALRELDATNLETYFPYIMSVQKHWWKDTIFYDPTREDLNGDLKNTNVYDFKPDARQTRSYDYTGDDSRLEGVSVRIEQVTSGDIEQIAEGVRAEHNTAFANLLADEYFVYDGTDSTADKIKRAKELIQIGKQDEADKIIKKKPILTKYTKQTENGEQQSMSTDNSRLLTSLGMLENVKTKDADFVLRDLKEALVELEYYTEDQLKEERKAVLDWLLEEYKPSSKPWPDRKTEKEPIQYGTLIKADRENTDSNGEPVENVSEDKMFRQGLKVITPGKGTIIGVGANNITIEFHGITYTEKENGEEKEVSADYMEGKKIYIQGIELAEGIEVGTELEKGQQIGITTGEDMLLILRNEYGGIMENIEEYMPAPAPKGSADDVTVPEGSVENPAGEDLERWREIIKQAIADVNATGPLVQAAGVQIDTSDEAVNRTLQQIQIESGGNPAAVNDWDSNASFDCSVGLMQVIAGTYNTYKKPGSPDATAFDASQYHSGQYDQNDPRFNGYYNIYAAIQYCAIEYGTPDLSKWPTTGGY